MAQALDIIITCGPIILAGMGLYVSIKPQPVNPWAHRIWLGAFFIVGGSTAIASYIEMHAAENQQLISSTTDKDTNIEIKDLIASIDKLSTGVAQINIPQNYQFLTNTQADALIQTLKPFSLSAAKLRIACQMTETRACYLANQWSTILKSAGWASGGVEQDFYMPPAVGVSISVNSAETPGAGIIQHALLTSGIVAQGQIDPTTPPNQIYIIFGAYKPSN